MTTYHLDPPAAQIAGYLSQGPALYELPLESARKLVNDAESEPLHAGMLDEAWITVPAGVGDVTVLLISAARRHRSAARDRSDMHGGGWILGSANSHGNLARDLAVASGAAVAFIDYALSPEAQYPVQIEQCYAVAQWIAEHGAGHGLDGSRMAVAGDSAGGNMATVLTILAKQRGDVRVCPPIDVLPDHRCRQ